MTASAADTCIKAGRARLALLVGLAAALACAKPPTPAVDDLLVPMPMPVRWMPEPSDLASARLARAVFSDDRELAERQLAEIEHAEDSHRTKGLAPLAQDAVNATLDDADLYREASRRLARRSDTDPALAARLEQSADDDPLRLARRRSLERWETLWARTFNAVAEPLGSSIITGFTLAPVSLATSGAHYLASFSNDEPASLTDRQALVLRREHLARHPDSEQAAELAERLERDEGRLARTLEKRRLRAARLALDNGQARVAVLEATRALHIRPSEDAEEIRDEALARVARSLDLADRSLLAPEAPPRDLDDPEARALAIELLTSPSGLSRRSLERLAAAASGVRADEAGFIVALAQHEAGVEDRSRDSLRAVASGDSHMARHARSLLDSPWQNAWESFVETRRRQRGEMLRWRLLGEWSRNTQYPNLPRAASLLVESPAIAQSVVTAPLRLIFSSWKKAPDFQRPTAVAAYRYLGLHPAGEHSREALNWLLDYESGRENWVAALRVADFIPDLDPDERGKLVEAASAQELAAAARSRRRDERSSILRHVVQEFPDSQAGQEAGSRARAERVEGSPQRIRMTRGFLLENPRVAGSEGLGLNALLLNGRKQEGELHPNGVTFLGGRRLRFDLLAASGDEDDEPVSLYRDVSPERLARVAAMLEEIPHRNQLIDADDELASDADRDQFLERARLGVAEEPDLRPSAESVYVYRSMRERYGMVRGRESILPFDLVLRGDFQNLSLGAFPRWRAPKETPDAFLYR